MPPVIDWQREAEEASLKQALAAEAQRDQKGGGPSKAKPEFGWDRSRVHRVEACAPMSMPEAATLPLTEWESFYVIIGGSAAALTGLMSLQRIQREQEKPGK